MSQSKQAVFAGGCFWCVEAVFKRVRGVLEVMPGYTGGGQDTATYDEVSSGDTGHAEAVRVTFDPAQVSFTQLLEVFFGSHDPTTRDRQGNDVGSQYRSAVFYSDESQKADANRVIEGLEKDGAFGAPIVTEVRPLAQFYAAEKEHRDFYDRNRDYPYCTAVINPKIAKLRQKYTALLKPEGGE